MSTTGRDGTPSSSDQRIGMVLAGKYELVRLVGSGGMGAVYEARHRFTHRRVAIKMLHPQIASSTDAAARFVQEAQAPSSIRHPGIVEVLDAGQESDGAFYIALEYLEGEDLASRMDRGPLDPALVSRIAWQLLDTLHAAHEHGFVHRDIKPQNIFLAHDARGPTRVKLLDFGIARQESSAVNTGLTQAGAILGTPMYMSPEQARGDRVDGRADLWSLGATMFHALSGRGPFVADNHNLLIVAVITSQAPSIATLMPDLDPALIEVVDRALQSDFTLRWSTAAAMANALSHVPGVRDPIVLGPPSVRPGPNGAATPTPATPAEALLPTLAATPASSPGPQRPVAPAPTPLAWDSSRVQMMEAPTVAPSDSPRSSRAPLIGVASLIVLGLLGGAFAIHTKVQRRRNDRVLAASEPDPVPRLIAPASLTTVATHRPLFRWAMPRRVEAVSLELCRDRTCADVVARTYATGTSTTLPSDLAAGHWYWRLRGMIDGRSTERTSPVWSFIVRNGDVIRAANGGRTPDLDGDGVPEVILGAPRTDAEIGRIAVYRSGAHGPSASPITLQGVDGSHGLYGTALASAGDVNGDGLGDLLVGAPGAFMQSGRAYLYLGRADATWRDPDFTLRGVDANDSYFGQSLAGVGDVNGDGYGDLAIGQWGVENSAGRVLIFNGDARGVHGEATATLVGLDGAGAKFGNAVAAAGDVNGDGFADIVVGAREAAQIAGRAYLFNGSAAGLNLVASSVLDAPDGAGGAFGDAVASAGDVNGDGFDDVLIAAPRVEHEQGRVYLFHGSAQGLSDTPSLVLNGTHENERFGSSMTAGDVNGDGLADIVVGAPRWGERQGRIYVFLGNPRHIATEPSTTLDGPDGAGGTFGTMVSAPGDLDGDGFVDVIVGAPGARQLAGVAYLFRGSATGLESAPTTVFGEAATAGSQFGSTGASSL